MEWFSLFALAVAIMAIGYSLIIQAGILLEPKRKRELGEKCRRWGKTFFIIGLILAVIALGYALLN